MRETASKRQSPQRSTTQRLVKVGEVETTSTNSTIAKTQVDRAILERRTYHGQVKIMLRQSAQHFGMTFDARIDVPVFLHNFAIQRQRWKVIIDLRHGGEFGQKSCTV